MATPHPTRQALIAAGLHLAEVGSFAGLSINAIVAEAQVAKGTFYVHFKNRQAYLLGLHQAFHEALLAHIQAATAELPPGALRLHVGISRYLDACQQQRGVKALLLEARSEPTIAQEVLRRNQWFTQQMVDQLGELPAEQAQAAARLLVAMTAEVALAELEVGQTHTPLREQLGRFLDSLMQAPASPTDGELGQPMLPEGQPPQG